MRRALKENGFFLGSAIARHDLYNFKFKLRCFLPASVELCHCTGSADRVSVTAGESHLRACV